MRYRPFYNWFFGSKKNVESNPASFTKMTETEASSEWPKEEKVYDVIKIDIANSSPAEISALMALLAEKMNTTPTSGEKVISDPILIEVLQVQNRQFELLKKKHAMYGAKNLAQGKEDMTDPENIKNSMRGIVIRLQDKLSRLAVMIDHIGTNNQNQLDESITDTLDDISNYGALGSVIASGKWNTK